MAIYTNYGRYLKAREFKEILDGENNETYMLFGIGNHLWDSQSEIPIAPYNTSIITDNTVTNNQFDDQHVNQYFMKGNSVNQTLTNGMPQHGSLADISAEYLPPFPCIWQLYDTNDVLISQDDGAPEDIKRDQFHRFYITSNEDTYTWYKIGDDNASVADIGTTGPITKMPAAQYFSELVLRGNALEHNKLYLNDNTKACVPVGLLGAVRCTVDFVRDIGTDEDGNYRGLSRQFFYGDRYWEIISPDEKLGQGNILPHHLIITSTINPRNMQEVLKLDQNIIPRQIAIYTRKKKIVGSDIKDGKTFYRVHQNLFNFGQYEQTDFKPENQWPSNGEILNFAPAYYTGDDDDRVLHQDDIDDRFNLLLVDYIKGSVRVDKHAIDRFGYVIGF
jgi:hypothetical protein